MPNNKSYKLNTTIMPNNNEKETMTQAFSNNEKETLWHRRFLVKMV